MCALENSKQIYPRKIDILFHDITFSTSYYMICEKVEIKKSAFLDYQSKRFVKT